MSDFFELRSKATYTTVALLYKIVAGLKGFDL